MATDLMIEASGVRKRFATQDVLRGVDLVVGRGTIVALLGPNGAGKTTMINILTTLVEPDAGEVTINGFDLARQADDVRRCISVTGQHTTVDGFLTGRESLALIARLAHLRPAVARQRVVDLIEQFELGEFAERRVATYSGGMRRRLDLAISLVAQPPLIFLDEPTTGLDPRSRMALWDLVTGLAGDGVTILLTTQYLEEADQLADRIAVIDGGLIVAEGTSAELKQRVSGERVVLGFANPHDFAAASVLLVAAVEDQERLTLSIETDRVGATIKDALDALGEGPTPVELASIEIARPTMDDVFFSLTARTEVAA